MDGTSAMSRTSCYYESARKLSSQIISWQHLTAVPGQSQLPVVIQVSDKPTAALNFQLWNTSMKHVSGKTAKDTASLWNSLFRLLCSMTVQCLDFYAMRLSPSNVWISACWVLRTKLASQCARLRLSTATDGGGASSNVAVATKVKATVSFRASGPVSIGRPWPPFILAASASSSARTFNSC